MRILIVGQNPSKKNLDPDIAFNGTESGYRLGNWVIHLGLYNGEYDVINCSDSLTPKWTKTSLKNIATTMQYVYDTNKKYNKVLALGNIASKILTLADIPHFKLPHPSGRNRKLNSPTYVEEQLNKCREYVHGLPRSG